MLALMLRLLKREWRSGELGLLMLSLVMAVTIVTGISLFTERLQQALSAQSSQFLAADRVLHSPRPVPPAWLARATELGLDRGEIVSFQSMLFAGDEMQLASVKAVSDSYPLRGQLKSAPRPLAAVIEGRDGPAAGELWLDARLLALLAIDIGDTVYVGEAELTASAILVSEPDQGSGMSGFGPRVMINLMDLAATEVVRPGSQVAYRYLFAGSLEALIDLEFWLAPRLSSSHRWQGLDDSQPRIGRSLKRARSFLLLAGALGVGLAGVAIALAARRYCERHYDYVAMMKTLGASSRQLTLIYGGKLLLLSLLATAAGALLALGLQGLLQSLLEQLLPMQRLADVGLPLAPFGYGAVTALVCLLAFAAPPLLSLLAVSPLRVLRRQLSPSEAGEGVSFALGGLAIAGLMLWYSGDWRLTAALLSGVLFSLLLAALLQGGLLRLARRGVRGRVGTGAGSPLGLALGSLSRHRRQNALHTAVFSLAIALVLLLALLRSSLIEEWQMQLPAGTPNHFLVNVADDQRQPLSQLLSEAGIEPQPLYPIVRGRLTHINDEAVNRRVSKEDPAAGSIDRELSLTWSSDLPEGNELVAGRWWSEEGGAGEQPLVSVESQLAAKLGLKVGDRLQFQLGSQQLEVTIASLRSLDWQSMRPNFYMIFPPQVLSDFSASFITSFYLPPEHKQAAGGLLNQLLRNYPTVSLIEMDSVIGQIQTIIASLSRALELVLALVVLCGLLVLLASVQAGLDHRLREAAVLRALGASRSRLLGALLLEFSALGAVAGALATLAAELSVFALSHRVLEMDYTAHPWLWLAGPLVGLVLIAGAGFYSCRRILQVPPMEALRAL